MQIGGGATELLAADQSFPYEIAVDATNAYWVAYNFGGTNSIGTVPIAGGPATMIPSSERLFGVIASNGANRFWTARGTAGGVDILTMPIGGASATLLLHLYDSPNNSTAIAVDASYLYFARDDGVGRIPVAGGSPIPLSATDGRVMAMAIDDGHVYWLTRSSSGTGSIQSLPKTGGTSTTLVASATGAVLVTDGTDLYWLETRDFSDFDLMSVPVAGGAPTTLVRGITNNLGDQLAVNEHAIVWGQDDKLMVLQK